MRYAVLLLPVLAALVPSPATAPACGPAPRPGQSVGVNAEQAVIIYDAATRTEHFIRRANFRTEATDFGFLVPTPTRPELGETKAEIFTALDIATQPRRVPSGKVQRIVRKRSDVDGAPRAGAPLMPGSPEVLEKKQVAGYDAVVLRADDTAGLKKWLEDHGYDARPALMTWLDWYVENRWIITAFRVSAAPASAHDRWAKAVRMSFETDAPFYPYREPADMRTAPEPGGRQLRVFFLGNARFEGKLGKDGGWAGRTVWAGPCPDSATSTVVGGLGVKTELADTLRAKKWTLTEFEDASSPRPGTDEVYFAVSKDQSPVERPVIYYDQYEYVDEDAPRSTSRGSSGESAGAAAPESEGPETPAWVLPAVGGGVLVALAAGALLLWLVRRSG